MRGTRALAVDGLTGAIKGAAARREFSNRRMLSMVAVFAGIFNAVNSSAVAWIKYHNHAVVPVWGGDGVMVNAIPSSVIPALFMVVLGTHAARRRLAGYHQSSPTLPASRIFRLPGSLLRRAAPLTLCTALIVVTVTYAGVTLAGITAVSFSALMAEQVIQACLMGACLGPIIVARVLRETPPDLE